MDEDMSLQIVFLVGQRICGKMRYKRVPYFTLKHMTFERYREAKEIIMTDLPAVAVQFLNLGYHVEYKGERVTGGKVRDVDDL